MLAATRTCSSFPSTSWCSAVLLCSPILLCLHVILYLRSLFLCLSRWSRPSDASDPPSDELPLPVLTSSRLLVESCSSAPCARVSSGCFSAPKRTFLPCSAVSSPSAPLPFLLASTARTPRYALRTRRTTPLWNRPSQLVGYLRCRRRCARFLHSCSR